MRGLGRGLADLCNRNSLESLWPTNAVGLSGDSIADPNTRKRLLCWMEGGSGRFRAMVSPKMPCLLPFNGDHLGAHR